MLKKVRVDQVRLGMHLHALCGSWIDHPFWQRRFVLREPADLARLQASNVSECVIDVSRGLDVGDEPRADADADTAAAAAAAAAAAVLPLPGPPPTTTRCTAAPAVRTASAGFAEEARRAAALVSRSRDAVESLFGEARMGRALDASGCSELVHDITASVWRNPGALVSLARLKSHDDYTYLHSVAVCALMVSLAHQLGMDEAQARDAGMAGLLHDIGKAALPLAVLNKPGRLSDAEMAVVRLHPQRGFELLRGSGAVGETALDVCLHHHERPDGRGYPHGLAGDAISLFARMGAVCDVYDAVTSDRPYKQAWDPAEAIGQMASWRKEQFDEAVFQAFVKSLGIYPIGSLVRLQSGRLAVVTEQCAASMVAPKVRVFFSTKSKLPLPLEVLDLSQPSCTDRIVGRESNADWKFPQLQELWVDAEVLRKMRKRDRA